MENSRFSSVAVARRLRWVMLAVILIDVALTALGQPADYWRHPAAAEEGNQLFRLFMVQGYGTWIVFELAYLALAFLIASLPWGRWALFGIFSYVLGHFEGACTWLTFHCHLGTDSVVTYAMLVAAAIVLPAFPAEAWPADPAKGAA